MSGRVLEFFEIDIPYCLLTWKQTNGHGTCHATGDVPCFNTLMTTQSPEDFSPATVTLRFAKPTDYLPRGVDIVGAWIKSIDHTSGTISIGENTGTRAVLKVALEDHPHSDAGAGLDKYQSDRGYDPSMRGSFWPRFRSRHPSLNGLECRWIIGFEGQALADMETRTFFIESYNGPAADGTFTITAKDVLKFLDGDRAQGPVLSSGALSGDISSSETSIAMGPDGVGDAEYPTGSPDDYYTTFGGGEAVKVTARSGDTLTVVRGQLGTVAAAHNAGDRVQITPHYSQMDAADVLYQHITTFSDLPPSYINLDDWKAETAAFLGTVYTFTITEPTSVAAFVSRVLAQTGMMMWDDPLAKQLRLKVIRAVPTSAAAIDEASVLNKTFEPTDQPDQRASRAWYYYAIKDPTKGRDDADNYRSTAKAPSDEDAEFYEARYGAPAITKIFADGIAAGGEAVAERGGNILVGRRLRGPRRFKFSLLRQQGIKLPALGGGYFLSWRSEQDETGERQLVPVQIIAAKHTAAMVQYTAEEMRFVELGEAITSDRVIRLNVDDFNINLRAKHDELYPPSFGNDITITFEVSESIGSESTALPAVDMGSWPNVTDTGNRTSGSPVLTGLADTSDFAAGMFVRGTGIPADARILTVDSGTQITLDKNATSGSATSTALTIFIAVIGVKVTGRIQGRGANGGTRGTNAGADGGKALLATQPFTLTGDGEIDGGAGGGSSGSYIPAGEGSIGVPYGQPGAGGGGAGFPPGAGGNPDGGAGTKDLGGAPSAGGFYTTAGGVGGGKGQPGAGTADVAGGAAGAAIDGNSFTEDSGFTGTVNGPRIN